MSVTVPAGSLMGSALSAEGTLSALADHGELVGAAQEMLEAVSAAGHVGVQPVGRGGSLIVGAASVLGGTAIRHVPLGDVGPECGKVLLIEAVAVGHGVVDHAVRRARRSGAEWVGVWVWRAGPNLAIDRMGADLVDVGGLILQ